MAAYVTMNHFRVDPKRGGEFEEIWRKRETHLGQVPGFLHFALLRGEDGHYISHSTWESLAAFEAWTRSDSFRKAHAQARTPEGLLEGHPKLECFEAILEQNS
jgi:heme-degrading monooxygenase HmoA